MYTTTNNVVMQCIIQMFSYKSTELWTLSYVMTAALLVRIITILCQIFYN